MTDVTPDPVVSAEIDRAVIRWMKKHGWNVGPARWELEPESGFHVWQETGKSPGLSHALWISESMVHRLTADQLIGVLEKEEMDQELRISVRMRMEERGSEYRISVVSRRSGEWKQEK